MADFDLAAVSDAAQPDPPLSAVATPSRRKSRYLLPKIEERSGADDDGIRLKLRWRKVRLSVPFGPS